MNSESLIKIQVEGNDIVIRCSIDDMVFIVENDPTEQYKIVDKERFAIDFCEALKNSSAFSGSGLNRVEEMFENGYNEVYTSASDSIINKNEGL